MQHPRRYHPPSTVAGQSSARSHMSVRSNHSRFKSAAPSVRSSLEVKSHHNRAASFVATQVHGSETGPKNAWGSNTLPQKKHRHMTVEELLAENQVYE